MEPEQENKKKSPAGLIIAIILLIGALGAFGYFGYNFYSEQMAKQELWEATAKARVTPLPTSTVPTPTPTPTATPRPAPEPDYTLLAKLKASGQRGMKITWSEVKGAKGYDVFFGHCGHAAELVGSVSAKKARVYKITGLEKQTSYKAYVKAWKKEGGEKVYIGSASPEVHAVTGGSTDTRTNAAQVTVKDSAITLTLGKSARIKAKVVGVDPKKDIITHEGLLRYYSSNHNVAWANADGTVVAMGEGTCSVYVLTTNGVYARVKVKVASNPTKLAFEESGYKVKVGKKLDLRKVLKVTPEDTRTTYTWESSAPDVAKVSTKGVVKGVRKGHATITVTAANGKQAKVKIVVR